MSSQPINTDPAPTTVEERQLGEDYKVWKKNHGFLYDLLMSYAVEWPSLTVQWLPNPATSSNPNSQQHRFIFGTYKNDEEEDLLIGSVNFATSSKALNENGQEVGEFEEHHQKIQIEARVKHEGQVYRARYMPQDPCLIASKGSESEVVIFRLGKDPADDSQKQTLSADLVLKGHDCSGFGLSWNPNKPGFLLSGSDDKKICLWDIKDEASSESFQPLTCFTSHEGYVEDVAWHFLHETLFGSVGADRRLMIWDTRSDNCSQPSHSIEAHLDSVTCLAFSPFSEYVFATGSHDTTIALWDLRNLKLKLHTCEGHKDHVLGLNFSPHTDNLLASSGNDKKLIIWDLNKIKENVASDDEEDGPAELIFRHSGHTGRITDFSWNLHETHTIISMADDNILQVWEMNEEILDREDQFYEVGVEEHVNTLSLSFLFEDEQTL